MAALRAFSRCWPPRDVRNRPRGVFTNPYAAHPLPFDTFLPWPTTNWSLVTPDEATADWVGDDPTLVLR